MQQNRTRLFVIVDPTSEHQVALVKALLIAKMADCHIHAFLCVYKDIEKFSGSDSRRDFKHDALEAAEKWLEQLMEPCRVSGVPYSTEIVWNSRWVDRAMHSAVKSKCSLVIKSSYEHSKARRLFRKTSDFTLMRYCACPILFTHQEQAWESDRVLACLDLESDDPQHSRLNNVILRDARAFADIVGMDLYLGSAYRDRLSAENLPLETRGRPVDAAALGELYDLDPARILLRQGEAVATLKAICEEIRPSLVVIGTIARTGVGGKLIGNTAEKLLDVIEADLLTVN